MSRKDREVFKKSNIIMVLLMMEIQNSNRDSSFEDRWPNITISRTNIF